MAEGRMILQTVAVTLVAWAALTAPALADPAAAAAATPASDAPLATAKGTPAAPPSTTQADIQRFIDEGAADDKAGPLPDRKPHGYVSVGVGSHGYKEVAGAITAPVGNAEVSLAIDTGSVDGRRR